MRGRRGIFVLVCELTLVANPFVLGADVPTAQYLTDLSRAQPNSALSQGPREGCWQLIPYETVDDANVKTGTMVGAASFIQVPEITIPLGVSGWHAVYLGYWNPYHAYDGGLTIKAKLSDDTGFVRMKQPEPSLEYKTEGSRYVSQTVLKEVFFRNADLTGRDLVLGKVCGPFGEKVYLAYVKLVPLSAEEVATLTSRRASPDARPLQGSIDGISYFFNNEYRTPQHLLELIEPYRYSEVGKIIWAVNYGETTNYPTRVGTLWGHGQDPLIREATNAYIKGEKVTLESLTSYVQRGILPQAVVASHAHSMGLKFDLMFRLGIGCFESLPPRRPQTSEGFLASHPEFRMALADGTRVEKASYAYPEVRAFMVSLVKEATETFDADGVCLGFVRGPEFLGYDPPVLEEFRRSHGEDGAQVSFADPRMRTVRSQLMTALVRDVRRVLDEVGQQKGKRLELSAWVYGGVAQNLDYGLDVVDWLNAGWLDSVLNTGDPPIHAAAQAKGCRIVSAVWDIDSSADTADGRSRDSQEVRQHVQDVSIKLKTIGGIDVGQGYWDTAFSGG